MKLVTFQPRLAMEEAHEAPRGAPAARPFGARATRTLPRAGILLDNHVLDAGGALEHLLWRARHRVPPELLPLAGHLVTVLDLLNAGNEPLRHLHDACRELTMEIRGTDTGELSWAYPAGNVRLKAPLPRPNTIRDFYAFEAHIKHIRESRGQRMPPEWYELPIFYFTNPGAVFGPDEEIPFPSPWTSLDYELEIACVIGKAGIDIPEAEAERYIAGYTIMNDWSARDIQQKEMRVGLGPAKGKDFATSLGPFFASPDELQPFYEGKGRYRLGMTARVNGALYSQGNLRDIHWTFPQMVAWASRNAMLYPGDVLGSGTVGTGCILELGAEKYGWLKPGDQVELEVDGLGRLCNAVGQPRQRTAS